MLSCFQYDRLLYQRLPQKQASSRREMSGSVRHRLERAAERDDQPIFLSRPLGYFRPTIGRAFEGNGIFKSFHRSGKRKPRVPSPIYICVNILLADMMLTYRA